MTGVLGPELLFVTYKAWFFLDGCISLWLWNDENPYASQQVS
jgi:hypothetical protein